MEKLTELKQLNQQISEYLIQTGVYCEEVAQFNYQSDSALDVYEDTLADIEDALEKLETKRESAVKTEVTARQKAKLPKLQINKYAGEPLQRREFWDKFNNTIHSSSLEDTTKFPIYMNYWLEKLLLLSENCHY